MNILFVGHILNPNDLSKFPAASIAGNNMQLGYIESLYKYLEHDIEVISQLPISIYPKSKHIHIKMHTLDIGNSHRAISPSFINLPFLKSCTLKQSTSTLIQSWLNKHKDNEKVIISFNTLPQIALPVIRYSKKHDVKTICIFADPPIDPFKRSIIGRIYKNYEFLQSMKLIKRFDGVIALNQKIVEDYAPMVPYEIIEGGINLDLFNQEITPKQNGVKRIVYSGALTEYSGCKKLIESLAYIQEKNFVIEFYGSGPLVKYIKSFSKNDARVQYLGIQSNQNMINVERNADFLINPRKIHDPISTYTFPSKILEYLATGTPTLSTKVNGLTPYYLNHLNIVETDDPISFAQSLEWILNSDYAILKEKALYAKKEILNEKNWMEQTKKLLAFINAL